MDIKYKIALSVLALAISYASGRYMTPEKIVTKEVTVTKEVVHENTDVHKNTQTKIVETTFPDGHSVKETYILDQDTVVIEKAVATETVHETTKTIDNQKPNYRVAAIIGTLSNNLKPEYGASIEKRVAGPIFAGINAHTISGTVFIGASAGLEF